MSSVEQHIRQIAWPRDWEFEFKGELDSGTRVFELMRERDDKNSHTECQMIELDICTDGSIWSGYGDNHRKLTIEEVEKIIYS